MPTYRIGLIDGEDIAWDWHGLTKDEAKRVMLELNAAGLLWPDFKCEEEQEEVQEEAA